MSQFIGKQMLLVGSDRRELVGRFLGSEGGAIVLACRSQNPEIQAAYTDTVRVDIASMRSLSVRMSRTRQLVTVGAIAGGV